MIIIVVDMPKSKCEFGQFMDSPDKGCLLNPRIEQAKGRARDNPWIAHSKYGSQCFVLGNPWIVQIHGLPVNVHFKFFA